MSKSVFSKIKDAEIVEREFTDPDTHQIISYKRLAVTIVVAGEDEVIDFAPPKSDKGALRLMQLADDVE